MVSVIAHMGIGILFAELFLRLRIKDKDERSVKRIRYWGIGLLAGLIPDLDIIPALIMGVHSYTYHHIFTHTFLAVGILAIVFLIFRKYEIAKPFVAGYYMHLVADFIDNSIAPLGPFDSVTEFGLLPGWGPIPGGSWASEYWLEAGYENHTLWAIFRHNGWGIPIGFEFLSIYDIVLIVITIILCVYLFILIFRRRRAKKGGTNLVLSLSLFISSIYPKISQILPHKKYLNINYP